MHTTGIRHRDSIVFDGAARASRRSGGLLLLHRQRCMANRSIYRTGTMATPRLQSSLCREHHSVDAFLSRTRSRGDSVLLRCDELPLARELQALGLGAEPWARRDVSRSARNVRMAARVSDQRRVTSCSKELRRSLTPGYAPAAGCNGTRTSNRRMCDGE